MYNSTPASKLAGYLCIALGFVLLLGGFFAYTYEQRWGFKNPITGDWTYTYSTYPHRDLGIVLLILGVVLIIVGAVLVSIIRHEP